MRDQGKYPPNTSVVISRHDHDQLVADRLIDLRGEYSIDECSLRLSSLTGCNRRMLRHRWIAWESATRTMSPLDVSLVAWLFEVSEQELIPNWRK